MVRVCEYKDAHCPKEQCKNECEKEKMTKPTEEQVQRVADAVYEEWSEGAMFHNNCLNAARAAISAYDSELAEENAELKAEIAEQCRIIGKSSEREMVEMVAREMVRFLGGDPDDARIGMPAWRVVIPEAKDALRALGLIENKEPTK